MTRDSDVIAQLEEYFEEYEGSTPAADALREAVRAGVSSIPQRPGWWPRENLHLNTAFAVSVVAAAAIVIGALLSPIAPGGPNIGGVPPASTPAASPLAWPGLEGTELAPGTYVSDAPVPVRTTISVPEGWYVCGVGSKKTEACARGDTGAVSVSLVANLVRDPCDRARALLDPPVGESVDDLVSALSALSGFEATTPIDITLDGFAGKQLELTAPTEPDCILDASGLGTWTYPGAWKGVNGVGPGEVNLLRIVDVDGVRIMIAGAYQPSSPADDIADVRATFESVRLSREP